MTLSDDKQEGLSTRRSLVAAGSMDLPRGRARRSRSGAVDLDTSMPLQKEPNRAVEAPERSSNSSTALGCSRALRVVNQLDDVLASGTGASATIAELAELVAARVVEVLGQGDLRPISALVTAAEVADRLGVCKSWVYANKTRLGAVKLGSGPRARLRFDLERVKQELGRPTASEPPTPPQERRGRSRKTSPPGVELLVGRSSR